ncbi:hypothetical protein [Chondromyces apiculatus]|uniref:PEGA domain-containing protein n=1 Tax=Chondromyces apiculatus DSM 436 TaxID=1192034 RepID=A0A017SUE6_9BACT|nr:hypothetical protein [Chondromyces apiculatus]EYF00588.1 Hypothetical protein CAP_0459 [Chondromyces apiculatus DSM 436]
MPRFSGIVLSLSLGLVAAVAGAAEPSTTKTAQHIYDQAVTDMEAGNFALACPRLKKVIHLLPEAIGAQLTLAECYEELGYPASALEHYLGAIAKAEGSGQHARVTRARAKAEALALRISALKVEVPETLRGLSGLELLLDGRPFEQARWGQSVLLDDRTYTLVASAPGYRTWSKQIDPPAEPAALKVTVVLEKAGSANDKQKEEATRRKNTRQRSASIVMMGVGAGIAATGGAFSAVTEATGGSSSDPGVVALWSGVAGGLLAGAGALIFFTTPLGEASPGKDAAVHARVGVHPGGLSFQSAW